MQRQDKRKRPWNLSRVFAYFVFAPCGGCVCALLSLLMDAWFSSSSSSFFFFFFFFLTLPLKLGFLAESRVQGQPVYNIKGDITLGRHLVR